MKREYLPNSGLWLSGALLAVVASACSGDTGAADSQGAAAPAGSGTTPINGGGQTGSLVPSPLAGGNSNTGNTEATINTNAQVEWSLSAECELPALRDGELSAVPGSSAFVVYSSTPARLAVTLTDEVGVERTVQLASLNSGNAQLASVEPPLESGEYWLSVRCPTATGETVVEATLSVQSSATPAAILGEVEASLELESGASCTSDPLRFTLTPTAEVLAYLPLLQIEVGVDGGPPQPVVPYGTAELLAGGTLELEMQRCEVDPSLICIARQDNTLSFSASIAGSLDRVGSEAVGFDGSCVGSASDIAQSTPTATTPPPTAGASEEPQSAPDETAACAMTPHSPVSRRPFSWGSISWLLGASLAAWRRRRRRMH